MANGTTVARLCTNPIARATPPWTSLVVIGVAPSEGSNRFLSNLRMVPMELGCGLPPHCSQVRCLVVGLRAVELLLKGANSTPKRRPSPAHTPPRTRLSRGRTRPLPPEADADVVHQITCYRFVGRRSIQRSATAVFRASGNAPDSPLRSPSHPAGADRDVKRQTYAPIVEGLTPPALELSVRAASRAGRLVAWPRRTAPRVRFGRRRGGTAFPCRDSRRQPLLPEPVPV